MSQLQLLLPQPCPESWDAMTPTGAGRHCAACQKTVVDFTQQTDAQILAYFRQARPGRTCGRFRAGQLGRPLAPRPARQWQGWLAAVLLAALATPGCTPDAHQPAATAAPAAAHPPLAATGPAAPAVPAPPRLPALLGFTVPVLKPVRLPPPPPPVCGVSSSLPHHLVGEPAVEQPLLGDTIVVGKPALPDTARTPPPTPRPD